MKSKEQIKERLVELNELVEKLQNEYHWMSPAEKLSKKGDHLYVRLKTVRGNIESLEWVIKDE